MAIYHLFLRSGSPMSETGFRGRSSDVGAQLISEHEFTSGIPGPGKAIPRLIFYVVASDKNPLQKETEVVVEKFEYLP